MIIKKHIQIIILLVISLFTITKVLSTEIFENNNCANKECHKLDLHFKHGQIGTDGCNKCHPQHESTFNKVTYKNKFIKEYLEKPIYTKFDLSLYELCFECHKKEIVLDKDSIITYFRNGNKNLHFIHVNSKKGRTCSSCHAIHDKTYGALLEKCIKPFNPYAYVIYDMGGPHEFTITKYEKTVSGGNCVIGCHKPRSYDRVKPIAEKEWY